MQAAAFRAAAMPARCAAVRPMAFLGAAAPRRVLAAPSRPFGGFAVAAPAPRTAAVVTAPPTRRGALLVMANNKKSMGCTKEGTRRKSARVSGFRARMSSTNGKNALARRRAKGRKVLCSRSVRKSAGKK